MAELLKNPHPGEILQEEFLEPLGLSQNFLAKEIGVPANRINALVRGLRGITADTDLRLSRFFGVSQGYWLQLQNTYDIMEVKRDHEPDIIAIQPYIGFCGRTPKCVSFKEISHLMCKRTYRQLK